MWLERDGVGESTHVFPEEFADSLWRGFEFLVS
jgi:hypothetical protein